MKRAPAIAVTLAAFTFPTACGRHGAAPPAPGTSASAKAPVAAAPSAPPATASVDPGATGGTLLAPAICRAIAIRGDAKSAAGTLERGAGLDRAGWLDIAANGSVSVQNTTTARELMLTGPAHAFACEHGEERFLLASGGISTSTWAGARPGAEVLVATPFGAIRYGDAKLEIHVDTEGLTVSADIGEAWVLPSGAGAVEEKVATGKSLKRRGPHPDVKALVTECEKRAAEAETRARAVLVPGHGAAPLGVRAAEHVKARRTARTTCAIAASAVPTAKTEAEGVELGRRVAYADARWRSVPPLIDSPTPSPTRMDDKPQR